jgi:hypothetical protein
MLAKKLHPPPSQYCVTISPGKRISAAASPPWHWRQPQKFPPDVVADHFCCLLAIWSYEDLLRNQ